MATLRSIQPPSKQQLCPGAIGDRYAVASSCGSKQWWITCWSYTGLWCLWCLIWVWSCWKSKEAPTSEKKTLKTVLALFFCQPRFCSNVVYLKYLKCLLWQGLNCTLEPQINGQEHCNKILRLIPFGNRTSREIFKLNWGFNGKIIRKWWILYWHVWFAGG